MTIEFTSATPARTGQAEDHTDDGVPRDHNDRYAICDENGNPPARYKNGNPIGRTRASTNAKVVGDKTGVQKWRDEMITRGLAADPALFTAVLKAVAADDKRQIRDLAEKAFSVGGGKTAASRGTAFHDVTERIKKGEQVSPDSIPAENKRDVDSYLQALTEHQIFPVAGAQELVLILPHGAAGKADDVFRWFNPFIEEWELIIGDTKTGQRIWEFGDYEMTAQLWQYANHLAVWQPPKPGEPEHGTPGPRLEVRRDRALIINSPLNGTTTVTLLDLAGAEKDMEAVQTIRRGRAEAKLRVHHLGTVDLREAVHTGTVVSADLQSMTPGGQPAMTDVQFTPTPTAPTPDAAAQEAAAQARMAKLDQMAQAAGRNDETDDDDQAPPPVPTHDPTTGRKKRACSFCQTPGHTAKNCPRNPDSPKYVPLTEKPTDALAQPDPTWMPTPEELTQAGIQPGQTSSVAQPAPLELHEPESGAGRFCPGSHDGKTVTGWTNGTDAFTGMSVDAHCGLPTQRHYAAMMASRAERSGATPAPVLTPQDQNSKWLAEAPNQAAVLSIRQAGIDSGYWSDDLDELARKRHFELATPPAWPAS